MPAYTLQGPFSDGPAGGTPITAAKLNNMDNGILAAHPLVKTVAQFGALSPADADEVYLEVDATNGIYWHLRYRAGSGSAYKWEFLGGPPFYGSVATSETASFTSFGDLATAGPSVTAPRAGEYEVVFGCVTINSVATALTLMTIKIGAAAAADANGIRQTASSANAQNSPSKTVILTAAALDVLKAQYRVTSGLGTWSERVLYVRPIRIS